MVLLLQCLDTKTRCHQSKRTTTRRQKIETKMYKVLSILAIITAISFNSHAQSSWAKAHDKAHKKEQLATNNSRLDKTVINNLHELDIKGREAAREAGLSQEGAILIEDLLKEAQSHIGKRYVWGSKGPNTFDCSGFTGYVYRQFDFKIGASSRDQYKYGKTIDKKNARRGDLIFFTSRRSGSNVGHVGIVWEVDKNTGDIKFIHASTKRGVIISELEGNYANRYVGIRRVIE